MVTSSKKAYATPRSAAPRAPAAGHCWPIPSQETLRGRSGSVSVGSLCHGAYKVLFEPSMQLWWVRSLSLNAILPLLPSFWGFSFVLGRGYPFLMGSNHLLSMVVQQPVVIFEFLQKKMGTCPSTLPSWLQSSGTNPRIWLHLPGGVGNSPRFFGTLTPHASEPALVPGSPELSNQAPHEQAPLDRASSISSAKVLAINWTRGRPRLSDHSHSKPTATEGPTQPS